MIQTLYSAVPQAGPVLNCALKEPGKPYLLRGSFRPGPVRARPSRHQGPSSGLRHSSVSERSLLKSRTAASQGARLSLGRPETSPCDEVGTGPRGCLREGKGLGTARKPLMATSPGAKRGHFRSEAPGGGGDGPQDTPPVLAGTWPGPGL